jgi:hypothetical protein
MKNIKIVDGLEVNPNLGSLDAGDPVVAVRIMIYGYGCIESVEKVINIIRSNWLKPLFASERTDVQTIYELKYQIFDYQYYMGYKQYFVSYFTQDAYREIESFLLAEGFVKTAVNAPFVVEDDAGEYYSTLDPDMHLVTGFRLPLLDDCPDKGFERFEY